MSLRAFLGTTAVFSICTLRVSSADLTDWGSVRESDSRNATHRTRVEANFLLHHPINLGLETRTAPNVAPRRAPLGFADCVIDGIKKEEKDPGIVGPLVRPECLLPQSSLSTECDGAYSVRLREQSWHVDRWMFSYTLNSNRVSHHLMVLVSSNVAFSLDVSEASSA